MLRTAHSRRFLPSTTGWTEDDLDDPLGHELHDRQTKYNWYRRFEVAHYWLLDPFNRTLDCLQLADKSYVTDAAGHHSMAVTPSLFPGLTLHLDRIWI